MLGNADFVKILYKALLGREADPDGLSHFTSVLDQHADYKGIINSIISGDEFAKKHAFDAPSDPLNLSELQERPLLIVDVGARNLQFEDHVYEPLLHPPLRWRCIGFEPQRHRLEERASQEASPHLTLHDTFIGDGSRSVFYIVTEDGSSSLRPLNENFNVDFAHIGEMRIVSTQEVATRTLDDVLAREKYVDFLKFDIQGFEDRALAGASELLTRTNVIHCEVFFGPMYQGVPFFSDIERILREADFTFIDFHHLTRYAYTRVAEPTGKAERLIWGDAIFLREKNLNKDDLVAQALIASLVYRKHGLAQKLRERLGEKITTV